MTPTPGNMPKKRVMAPPPVAGFRPGEASRDVARNRQQDRRSSANVPSRPARAQQDRADHSTAPYTFVPFGPTITAAQLGSGPELTGGFAGPVAGTLTGHLDLTLTTLSPLFVGGPDGGPTSFRWRPNGNAGIPGSTLHGMLRGVLAHLLGGGLGPVPDRRIYYRAPVSTDDEPNPLNGTYTARRGRATAGPGKQRIGLLTRTAGGYAIAECVQLHPFSYRRKEDRWVPFRQVPRVRWDVLRKDLGVRRAPDDARLKSLQWQRLFVVWALVSTAPGGTKPRPVVVGVGESAQEAEASAAGRKDSTEFVPDRVGNRGPEGPVEFVEYLPGGAQPRAVTMRLVATGLDEDGSTSNAYLFAERGSAAENLLIDADATGTFGELRTQPDLTVSTELVDHLVHAEQCTDYQRKAWPAMGPFLADVGVPVFFDAKKGATEAHWIGRSGGFRILARHTLLDTVPPEVRDPGPELPALHALLGHVPTENDRSDFPAIAGRVMVGHAHADGAGRPLKPAAEESRHVVLMTPKVKAHHLRLQVGNDENSTPLDGYENGAATYRGRQVYHHRWRWSPGTTAERAWIAAGDEHVAGAPEGAEDPRRNPDVRREVHPLEPGLRFTARIRFTNLTPAELGALLFAVHLGNASDGAGGRRRDFAHRIGGLKPLGLGSVHLAATAHVVAEDRYQDWTADPTGELEPDREAEYVTSFLAAIGADAPTGSGWVRVPETGRAWPRHIAGLLLAARWERQLGRPLTREMTVKEHQRRMPLRSVFALHER